MTSHSSFENDFTDFPIPIPIYIYMFLEIGKHIPKKRSLELESRVCQSVRHTAERLFQNWNLENENSRP